MGSEFLLCYGIKFYLPINGVMSFGYFQYQNKVVISLNASWKLDDVILVLLHQKSTAQVMSV